MSGTGLPLDWYRNTLNEDDDALFFDNEGEEAVELAIGMLDLDGYERVLDLACACGTRTLALSRRGYDVVGAEGNQGLVETAAGHAETEGLDVHFVDNDPRYMDFDGEFDVVLSIGGGAFEHFDYDEEGQRAFAAARRALRPGGRLLMKTPNVLFVEAHLPERTWIEGKDTIELVEQRWVPASRRLEGTRRTLVTCEVASNCAEHAPFQRRLYSVEELAETFNEVGLRLSDVFDENGQPCAPDDTQREIFVEARL